MSTSLTIRLRAAQREALKRRASALNTTESGLIRELVEREIAEVPFPSLVAKWAGTLNSKGTSRPPHPLKRRVRERNWRA